MSNLDDYDYSECTCECHNVYGLNMIDHCVPCCESCVICGAHIKYGFMEDHVKGFHKEECQISEGENGTDDEQST